MSNTNPESYPGFPFPALDENADEIEILLFKYFPGGWNGSTRTREDQLIDTLRLFGNEVVIEYPEGV